MLVGLMSLLGFSSCEKNDNEGGAMVCGSVWPYAEFVVSGKVTDSDDRGLQDIGVIVSKADHHQRATSDFIPDRNVITYEIRDTLWTSANGDFEYHYSRTPGNDSINIHIKFEDLSENARFEADSAKVTFFDSDLKGGEEWYKGRAEKNINVKLKKKRK
jgi:putative lipoprotein (rSAM/lipoprotein system)